MDNVKAKVHIEDIEEHRLEGVWIFPSFLPVLYTKEKKSERLNTVQQNIC
jgi:hypothetical protein